MTTCTIDGVVTVIISPTRDTIVVAARSYIGLPGTVEMLGTLAAEDTPEHADRLTRAIAEVLLVQP